MTDNIDVLAEKYKSTILPKHTIHEYMQYTIDTFDYEKNDAKKYGQKTGKALLVNKCDNLAVIDIDIKHDLSVERKNEIQKSFVDAIESTLSQCPITKSGNGGLHIFTRLNGFVDEKIADGNRYTKIYKSDDYDVDLFVGLSPDKRSLLMLPGSKIKNEGSNKVLEYTYLNGDENMIIGFSCDTVMGYLQKLIPTVDESVIYKKLKPNHKTTNDNSKTEDWMVEYQQNYSDLPLIQMSDDELFEFLCNIEDNYNNLNKIMVNFMKSPFSSDYVEKMLCKWYSRNKHDNGTRPVERYMKAYYEQEMSNRWFFSILKHIRTIKGDEIADELKEKYCKKISLYDGVLSEVEHMYELEFISFKQVSECQTLKEKFDCLKRCIVNASNLKCWFSRLQHDTIDILKYTEIDDKLKTCGISKLKDRNAVKDALYTNYAVFENINFETLFCGWKYTNCVRSEIYEQNVKDFKECVMLNICSNDEQLFEYLMNRISFILHNPGKLSKVCVVFQGLEGTGKNWFCDIIANIFSRYSSTNTNLNKLTAKFNANEVIGRCYVVCNEALDADGFYNMSEEMKKIIERSEINCEKKGIDSMNVKNSLNVDITSNNIKPVIISPNDRRYLNIRTNPLHADDRKYWKYYQEEVVERTGFYSDIFNMIYDDYYNADFLSIPIPMTEAKKRLIRLCMNVIDKYIIDNLERFEVGLTTREIRNSYDMLSNQERGRYGKERFVAEVINKCVEVNDTRNKCVRYRPSDRQMDRYTLLVDDEETDEQQVVEPDDETEKIYEEFDEWIINNQHETEDYYYVLAKDLPSNDKQRMIDYMKSKGWEYRKQISRQITKRGYKQSTMK